MNGALVNLYMKTKLFLTKVMAFIPRGLVKDLGVAAQTLLRLVPAQLNE